MNTTSMPGFTAENSIYWSRGRYCKVTVVQATNTSAIVQPAMPKICYALEDRLFEAYNAGYYSTAEFWQNIMEAVGCFK